MPEFSVLYYPEFEPPEIWLRNYLLFYDKINTIIPDEVKTPFSDDISKFLEILPKTIEGIPPRHKEIDIDDNNLTILGRAFETIKNQKTNQEAPIIMAFPRGGIGIGGNYFAMHNTKFSDRVTSMLEDYHLFWEGQEKFLKYMEKNGINIPLMHESKIVDKDAGHLIMSIIANNIARNYGLNSITYKQLDFTVNELISLKLQQRHTGKSHLISSMIRCEVPADITKLSLEQYKEIRESYSDIKDEFHNTLSELNSKYNIEQIEDPQILNKKVREVTQEFNKKFEDYKQKQLRRRIRKWAPIYISSFCVSTGQLSPDWRVSVTFDAVGIASIVIPNIFPMREIQHEKYMRLLANMQKDIIGNVDIRRLYPVSEYTP